MPPLWQIKSVTAQLTCLEYMRTDLIAMMDEIGAVSNVVKDWIDGREEKKRSYLDMCLCIETVFKTLSKTCMILASSTLGEEDIEIVSRQKSQFMTHGVASDSSSAEASTIEPTKDIKIPFDGNNRQMRGKIVEMEEAISELRMTTKSVLRKQAKSDRALNQCTSEISARCEDIESNSNQLNKTLFNVTKDLNQVKKDVGLLNDKDIENKSKLDSLMEEIQAASDYITNMKEEVIAISTRVEEINVPLQYLLDLKLKTVHLENLSQQLMTSDCRLKAFSIEENIHFANVQQKLTSLEDQYGTVCELLYKRLKPLEQLRDIFNQNLSARTENNKHLETLNTQLCLLQAKINELAKSPSGFLAFACDDPTYTEYERGERRLVFRAIEFDHGATYDVVSGCFTAHSDGFYLVCCSVDLDDGDLRATIVKSLTPVDDFDFDLSILNVNDDGKTGCMMFVEKLLTGEQLTVKADIISDIAKITTFSYFCCFKIG